MRRFFAKPEAAELGSSCNPACSTGPFHNITIVPGWNILGVRFQNTIFHPMIALKYHTFHNTLFLQCILTIFEKHFLRPNFGTGFAMK